MMIKISNKDRGNKESEQKASPLVSKLRGWFVVLPSPRRGQPNDLLTYIYPLLEVKMSALVP